MITGIIIIILKEDSRTDNDNVNTIYFRHISILISLLMLDLFKLMALTLISHVMCNVVRPLDVKAS